MVRKLHKSQIFLYICLIFLSGVFVYSLVNFETQNFASLLIILFFSILIFGIIKNWKILFCIICFLIFVTGGYYLQSSFKEPANPYEEEVIFYGAVVKEPDIRSEHTRLTVEPEGLEGKVLLKADKYPEYDYGDYLEVGCKLRKPEKIEDFSYDKYLARFDIYSLCYQPQINLIEKDRGNIFLASIFKFKKKLMGSLEYVYPAPVSQVMAGILLGMKKGLPEEVNQDFIDTGTIHIMVVSGFNVMIVSAVVMGLFRGIGIGRKKLFYFLAIFIFIFVILTGGESSVVRAMIMALACYLGEKIGRPRDAFNVLVFTATLMVVINPKILVFDAGFQLSFLATMALVYLGRPLQKIFKLEVVSTTMAAIIFTSPLVMFQFGRISLVALIANILIVPFISPLTIFGMMNLGIGLILPKLAFYLGSLAWLIGTGIIKGAEVLANWKYASLEVPAFPAWVLAVVYGGLFLGTYLINKNKVGFKPRINSGPKSDNN